MSRFGQVLTGQKHGLSLLNQIPFVMFGIFLFQITHSTTLFLTPPHLINAGENGWQFKKYGRLDGNWQSFISEAFAECMRVLKPNGTLIFKWNETQIPVEIVLSVIPFKPLYGHKSGKASKTHWIAFMKDGVE